jgi:hypothetical protein
MEKVPGASRSEVPSALTQVPSDTGSTAPDLSRIA